MRTILVTGVGGPAGRALVQQLADLEHAEPITIIGADVHPVELPGLALCEAVPRADDPAYLVAMRQLVGRVRADLIIPTVQDELVQMSTLGSVLGNPPGMQSVLEGIGGVSAPRRAWFRPKVVISKPTATAIAADKLTTMWALAEAGVAVPAFGAVSEFTSTQHALDRMRGPVVVKPRVSRGGRGVQVIENASDLDWGSLDDGLIVQEFASGTEYAAQVYRSPVDGRTQVVVLEKTAMKQGRVGNAVTTRRVEDEEACSIYHVATAAATALDLTGPLDMDVRLLASGVPVVLEVNARFGANSALAPELLQAVLRDYVSPLPPEITEVGDPASTPGRLGVRLSR